jgi:hypothetical protein
MSFGFEPDTPTSVEETGPSPRVMTGMFTQLIRHTFSAPDHIENPLLRTYLWNENEKISKIVIGPSYNWKPEDIQQRPAVTIQRGAYKFGQLGIGNRLQSHVEETGFQEDQYMVHVAGSHVLNCIGTSGSEAEGIAEEVWKTLLAFSAQIREQFCLGKFQVSRVGSVNTVDESRRHFVVPVGCQYQSQLNWSVTRRTPEWNRVTVQLES